MDDLADLTPGSLLGRDTSDEPRIERSEAVAMIARAGSRREVANVLAFVRPKDHRRVLAAADIKARRAADVRARSQWTDEELPFGSESA